MFNVFCSTEINETSLIVSTLFIIIILCRSQPNSNKIKQV